MKKTDIINQIKTWIGDIDYDLKADWTTPQEKTTMSIQKMQLSMTLGLLESLGENCNIEE